MPRLPFRSPWSRRPSDAPPAPGVVRLSSGVRMVARSTPNETIVADGDGLLIADPLRTALAHTPAGNRRGRPGRHLRQPTAGGLLGEHTLLKQIAAEYDLDGRGLLARTVDLDHRLLWRLASVAHALDRRTRDQILAQHHALFHTAQSVRYELDALVPPESGHGWPRPLLDAVEALAALHDEFV